MRALGIMRWVPKFSTSSFKLLVRLVYFLALIISSCCLISVASSNRTYFTIIYDCMLHCTINFNLTNLPSSPRSQSTQKSIVSLSLHKNRYFVGRLHPAHSLQCSYLAAWGMFHSQYQTRQLSRGDLRRISSAGDIAGTTFTYNMLRFIFAEHSCFRDFSSFVK